MSEQKTGGFFNGFVWGLFVGAGLVFLFGTSKGKKILQMLLEQVEENTELSDLLEMPEEEEYMGGEEEEPMREEKPEALHTTHKEESHSEKQHPIKRFFKSGSKKIAS